MGGIFVGRNVAIGIQNFNEIIEKLEHYETKDYIEENLVRLLKLYRIQSQKGEEIGELYRRGYEKE